MNIPMLPSARPNKAAAAILLSASGLMLIAGIGLAGSAVIIYHGRGQQRINQTEALTQMQQDAERRQTKTQLSRGQQQPIWVNNQTYDREIQYTIEGRSEVEVPVLMGYEIDNAVCIGTMSPDGFRQNPDHQLCLGY